jgi:hypothetical protein
VVLKVKDIKSQLDMFKSKDLRNIYNRILYLHYICIKSIDRSLYIQSIDEKKILSKTHIYESYYNKFNLASACIISQSDPTKIMIVANLNNKSTSIILFKISDELLEQLYQL